ncbi:MAG: YceH family protein [Planctomycetota bacterium]
MINLKPNEARVLGVLVEKAYTTPGQYPMTLNAIVNGSNQKSNRDPVTNLDEDDVQDALDSLRAKQIVREVYTSGSRVAKYRQLAKEAFDVDPQSLAVLAELLLRGPQTLGELRGRARRMQAMDSTEVTREALTRLMDREEPYVRVIPAAPGSRAERYLQLLCPDLHQVHNVGGLATSPQPPAHVGGGVMAVEPVADAGVAGSSSATGGTTTSHAPSPSGGGDTAELRDRLMLAEREIERLKRAVRRIADTLGEDDPLGGE